jgi:hypothetical protein
MATCCGLRSLFSAAAFMDDRRAAHNALVLCMAVQQQDPIGFLASLPPAQHAPPAATPWQPGGAPRGHVGLEVTKRAPFQVVAIDRLMDLEGRVQGQPGYANKLVQPGDLLLRIGGETIGDVRQLQRLMPGPPQSVLEIDLSRGGVTGDEYSIRIQRSLRQDDAPHCLSEKRTGRWHDVSFLCLPHAQVGLEVDRHGRVERVVDGSPADVKGGVRVGDMVRQIDGRPCQEQAGMGWSGLSGDAGTKVCISFESQSGVHYDVHLVRELACQLGKEEKKKCGLRGGASICIAYLAGKSGATETLCLTVKMAVSGDEVLMEGASPGPGGGQRSLSTGSRRRLPCL